MKPHYHQWKLEKDPWYSDNINFQKSLEHFFLSNEPNPQQQAALTKDAEMKKQSILQKTAQMFIRSDSLYNPDKRQVGIFYNDLNTEGLTKEEMVDVERRSRASNSIFQPNAYTSQDWRRDMLVSSSHAEHSNHQFIGDAPSRKYNLRRTVISEYSNALHNQTVFINPRFMSC